LKEKAYFLQKNCVFRNILLPLYPKNQSITMKLTKIILILCLACISIKALPQTTTNTLPDLYTADQTFFDPTRKNQSEEKYEFSAPWRLELGYVQFNHRTQDTSAVYLHGLKLGATVDFILPRRFSIQTGALISLAYGINNQHWPTTLPEEAQINILQHNILQLQLSIPVRAYYNIKVWKDLNFLFFAGPQLNIGLTNYDIVNTDKLSPSTLNWLQQEGVATTPHDRYVNKQLYRTNIQMGVGGGLEWQQYRVIAGYDFGLNNLLRTTPISTSKMYEWGWYATFSYKL
jgi:hypothetical protein